jgi:hypothetical protein
MIRIGMNKKTGEPVNDLYPFYYKIEDAYTPYKSLSFGDEVQLYYRQIAPQKRIVWLEANEWVNDVRNRFSRAKIRVLEQNIIKNDKDNLNMEVCSSSHQNLRGFLLFSECIIKGPCNLIFDPESTEKVFIETDSEVIINNFKS